MVILKPSKGSCYGDLVPNCEMIHLWKAAGSEELNTSLFRWSLARKLRCLCNQRSCGSYRSKKVCSEWCGATAMCIDGFSQSCFAQPGACKNTVNSIAQKWTSASLSKSFENKILHWWVWHLKQNSSSFWKLSFSKNMLCCLCFNTHPLTPFCDKKLFISSGPGPWWNVQLLISQVLCQEPLCIATGSHEEELRKASKS